MRIFLLSFLVLLPTLMFAQFRGDTYSSAKAKGSATWTITYANAPGFISADGNGKVTGITVDLMNAFRKYVEEKAGIAVKIEYAVNDADNFTQFLNDVKEAQGGVFGLSNTTITEQRKKYYNFSPPYITNIGMIISHRDAPTVTELGTIGDKFNGMTAVTVKNSTNAQRLLHIRDEYFPGLKIEYVPSFQEALDAVATDKSKFTDVDFTYYLSAIQAKKPVKRHPGGDDITEKFGIIMPKSNDWAPLLSEFMNSGFVGGMEYKKIISTNLGQSAMKYLDTL